MVADGWSISNNVDMATGNFIKNQLRGGTDRSDTSGRFAIEWR